MDGLDLVGLTPRVRLYFGPFIPVLRSLAIRNPHCARGQLFYFVGLFPNLDDLKLIDLTGEWIQAPAPVPQSALLYEGV